MNNENGSPLEQNQEQPKNFWQRLKLWQKIGLIVLAVAIGVFSYYILIRPLLFPPTLFYSSITEAPDTVFNAYLQAEENCDIELANSIITEKSKEIMHYTCSNMAEERKCHVNKTYKVLIKGDTAIIHFDDFSHKTGWPFFFAKENGEWKIDFYKMANGITMGGSGCDTGWGWRNDEIKQEFCSYFKEGECPEEIDSGIQKELSSAVNKTEFQINEEVKLTISNNFSEAIKIYNMSAEKFDNDEWKIVRYDISCPCLLKCEKFTPILSMNANRQFAWDQKETNCQKVGEGTYRFKIAWGPKDIELYVPKLSYSNEFKIIKPTTSFQDVDLSCNTNEECIARFSHCDCDYHCLNKVVKYKDCSNECDNPLRKAPLCYCISNECINGPIIYSKSCDELDELRRQEFNKIDLSCKTDADCIDSDAFLCVGCMNKNANTETYEAILDMENTKNCPLPLLTCPFFTGGCKCASNKCEGIYK